MYNVHKTLIAAISGCCIVAAATTSCSGDKNRQERASQLLEQARSLVAAHSYDSAMSVLDTLDVSYRDCLDQRKEGTTVRLTALSNLTRDSLASAEQQMLVAKTELDELQPKFKKIDIAGTDGYYVYSKTFSGSEMNKTGLQSRVDDQGYLFVIANVSGKNLNLRTLEFNGVSTQPGQSMKVEGSEIMSLSQEQTSEFVNALAQATAPAIVKLNGSKGKVDVKLSASELEAIRITQQYANALQRVRKLSITLEKLERQLAKINDNIANQIPVDAGTESEK